MSTPAPIPYGKHFVDSDDIGAVINTLRSGWIAQGPAIESFERAMAVFCGARHAVAVSSATAALHIGALALELGPGDRFWTSPNTFVASANCGLYCGARVDFVDIDPRTYNMSVSALQAKLKHAQKHGALPKIIVPVHFSGQSCEMTAIRALASQYGCRVMEDASHAVGGEYGGRKIGSGAHADLTVFSFHPVKIMTTGEGGMLLTNEEALYHRLLRLRSHGITRDSRFLQNMPDGPWSYEQVELGFNYRITDLQAALGESQLNKLPRFVQRRRDLAARYNKHLAALPLTCPWQHPDTLSSWHLYVIQLPPEKRLLVYEALKAANIHAQVHYIPVHTQPHYRDLGFRPGDFPGAEAYYARALSLPIYYSLTDSEQDRVVATLTSALEE